MMSTNRMRHDGTTLVEVPSTLDNERTYEELQEWTYANDTHEVVTLAVGFLLHTIFPAYKAGYLLVLRSPDKQNVQNVTLDWNLNKKSSAQAPRIREASSRKKVVIPSGLFAELESQLEGAAVDSLPAMTQFAINCFHTAMLHHQRGWTLFKVRRQQESSIRLGDYIRKPEDRPASALLGFVK